MRGVIPTVITVIVAIIVLAFAFFTVPTLLFGIITSIVTIIASIFITALFPEDLKYRIYFGKKKLKKLLTSPTVTIRLLGRFALNQTMDLQTYSSNIRSKFRENNTLVQKGKMLSMENELDSCKVKTTFKPQWGSLEIGSEDRVVHNCLIVIETQGAKYNKLIDVGLDITQHFNSVKDTISDMIKLKEGKMVGLECDLKSLPEIMGFLKRMNIDYLSGEKNKWRISFQKDKVTLSGDISSGTFREIKDYLTWYY